MTARAASVAKALETAEFIPVVRQAVGLSARAKRGAGACTTLGQISDGALRGRLGLVDPLVHCGVCPACRMGQTNDCKVGSTLYDQLMPSGEPLMIPPNAFVPLPLGLTPAKACMVEPLAWGWHRARLCRRAFPQGRRALVIGDDADAVGAALALRAQGLDGVHLMPLREERADFLGAHTALALRKRAHLAPATYDLVVNMAGAAEDPFAFCLIGTEGAVARGLRDANDPFPRDGVEDVQTQGYTAQDFQHTAFAAAEGRLGALEWAETAPLDEAEHVLADWNRSAPAAPMVILTR